MPATHLSIVNADLIADERRPGATVERPDAAPFTEMVCGHPSEADLVAEAIRRRYMTLLLGMLVPVDLSVHRVAEWSAAAATTVRRAIGAERPAAPSRRGPAAATVAPCAPLAGGNDHGHGSLVDR